MLATLPPAQDLTHELSLLYAERDALVTAQARAELAAETATAAVEAARQAHDAAIPAAKEATRAAAAARRALQRHDEAIYEAACELAASSYAQERNST